MTPAVTFLKKQGVDFDTRAYELAGGEENTYGEAVAAAIGADPERVFKTLVAQLDTGELVVAIVPVTGSLDLRALARAAGAKTASMAKPDAAEKSTGYVTGGISPFGQRKRLRTLADRSLASFPRVFVSGGKRGLQVEVAPDDLVRLCDARLADLAK